MANLEPLIRVRKHVVEQKQKFLAELFRQSEELDGQKAKLLSQLAEERIALQDIDLPEAMTYFGRYSDVVHERVGDIDDAREKLERRIQMAQDDMREAFSELKKVEITDERRKEEETAALNKKESDELDEIAIDSFRRKAEEA